ncbi:hypothetical protein GUJ93_ZPchr0006g46211 [Zizania palustris]|uniref:Uncharacterized protein n=1 Tax=Zizania palustris TaxID=103762 RepID=A0A8J5SM36_ZIZPA|nr:hypothetical protein GUJ93_ZPchr0006g46211 [Zizania palustris]
MEKKLVSTKFGDKASEVISDGALRCVVFHFVGSVYIAMMEEDLMVVDAKPTHPRILLAAPWPHKEWNTMQMVNCSINKLRVLGNKLTLHMPELLGYHMAFGSGGSPNGILVMLKDYSLTPIVVVKEAAYWKLDGYDNNAIMMLQYFDTDDSMENKDKWFVLNEDEHKMVDDYVSKGGMEYAIASCDKAPSFELTLHMAELLGYHMAFGSSSSPNGILVKLKDYSLTPIVVVKEAAYWKLDGYDNNAIMMLQYFDTDDSMENKDKWFVLNEDEHKMVDDYVSKGGMEYAIASCDKAPSFELTLHMPELLGYHKASGSSSSPNGILVKLKDYSLTVRVFNSLVQRPPVDCSISKALMAG